MFKTRLVRSVSVASLVVLGAIGAVSTPNAALAADLAVDSLRCGSTGGGEYRCEATVSGGTGRYAYAWSVTPLLRRDTENSSTIVGRCEIGTTMRVGFGVRDSAGATASAATSFLCTR